MTFGLLYQSILEKMRVEELKRVAGDGLSIER